MKAIVTISNHMRCGVFDGMNTLWARNVQLDGLFLETGVLEVSHDKPESLPKIRVPPTYLDVAHLQGSERSRPRIMQ